jgi:hypothetical protein
VTKTESVQLLPHWNAGRAAAAACSLSTLGCREPLTRLGHRSHALEGGGNRRDEGDASVAEKMARLSIMREAFGVLIKCALPSAFLFLTLHKNPHIYQTVRHPSPISNPETTKTHD